MHDNSTIRLLKFIPEFGLGCYLRSDDEEDEGNTLMIHFIWGKMYIHLPKIIKARYRYTHPKWDEATVRRLGRDWCIYKTPKQFGFTLFDNQIHMYYGIQPMSWTRGDPENSDHTKIFTFPWADWIHLHCEVMMKDGSWEETHSPVHMPRPKQYHETFEYAYPAVVGHVIYSAFVCVERREWRLRWLQWTSLFAKKRQYIEVKFLSPINGTTGCGYEMLPTETPEQCLRRMEQTRQFNY